MQKSATRRVITNENDENATAVTRVTRAKAALCTTEVELVQKALGRSKSTTVTTSTSTLARKRNALEDVSNVAKAIEANINGKSTGAKKQPLGVKNGNVAKAGQPTKVQKLGRSQSTRSIVGQRTQKGVVELKRPAPASGVGGHVTKKRLTGSASSKTTLKDEESPDEDEENVAPAHKPSASSAVESSIKVELDRSPSADFDEPLPKELPPGVPDLDLEDLDDPLMVAEYVTEIFDYLRELELQTMANPKYMNTQKELEWSMRGILVDWLIEVHAKFGMLPETLYLTVNIIDRFLSTKVVQLDRLQLVGVTAMFIAAKYEEVFSPHVTGFRHVSDDGFSEEEILSAERYILTALNYDLSYPNPMNFLRRISKADQYDVQVRTLGKYLLEISCLDHRFIGFEPSRIAAAAMYFARMVLERSDWVTDSQVSHDLS
jgi:G2/mitotic-specific cyclin 2